MEGKTLATGIFSSSFMIPAAFLMALMSLGVTATASGPAAKAHDIIYANLLKDQENPLQWGPLAPKLEVEVERAEEQGGPRLNVVEEAAHGLLPPPLWDALFRELPDTLVTANSDLDIKEKTQGRAGPGLLGILAPLYLPGLRNVSRECRRDVWAINRGFSGGKLWAQKVVDSWGKFTDGLIAGNLWTPGMLDECLRTKVDSQNPEGHFSGRYCSFSIGMKYFNMSAQQLLWEREDEEYSEYEDYEEYNGEVDLELQRRRMLLPSLRIGSVKGFLHIAVPFNLLATCIPSTCTEDEYRQSLEKQLDERNLTLTLLGCQTKELPTLGYSAGEITMIITLTLLGVMVLVGTVADVWMTITKNERLTRGPLRYFLVFSFYTNLPKIFHINNKETGVISCLHGIRALTMGWVVMGHSYLLALTLSANKGYIPEMVKEHPYFYQLFFNAYPSVDTFFVMTGLLVAYNLTKEFKRTSSFNIPFYYVHRFIRLAPSIMLLCGFFAVFPPLFIQGSLSPLMVRKPYLVDSCIRHWWRDSFFLTNLFTGTEDGGSCIPVCWYTAVEFQLYIVTPLMFVPLLYRRKLGLGVMGVCILASVVVPMAIIGAHQLPPTNVIDASLKSMDLINKEVYSKPWCRASPYLVGLALGYFLQVVDKEKVQLKWWQACLGWIAALVIMSTVVFGLKDYNTMTGVPHEYDAAVSILYGGLHRLAWGVAIAWLVFACHMGYGGPANSLLAHPVWQPISRLTYTTFLIAFNAQSLYYNFYARLPSYYTPFYQLMETVGILLVSGCGAVLLSLLTESPVMGLEKLLLGRGRKQLNPPNISSASSPTTTSGLSQTTLPQTTSTSASSTEPHSIITSTS